MNARTGDRSGWYWLFGSVVLVAFAQLVFKFAMEHLPGEPGLAGYLRMLAPEYVVPVLVPILFGLVAYTASVFCWLNTLARLPLSLAYPSLALSYLLVILGATLLPMFHEAVTATRLLGVALVMVGVILVGRQGDDA